jgi:hypothetical protein
MNQTTGPAYDLSDLVTPSGEEVVQDMARREVHQ